jgi:hypothetical protein
MCVTMDRYEADWKIVERGWAAHVLGEAPHKFTDAGTAIKTLRVGTAGATTGGEGSLQALRAGGYCGRYHWRGGVPAGTAGAWAGVPLLAASARRRSSRSLAWPAA